MRYSIGIVGLAVAVLIGASLWGIGDSRKPMHDVYPHMQIPSSIDGVVREALAYYPELKEVNIHFVLRPDEVPLTTMPTFWSVFRSPKHRKYEIIISTKSDSLFDPILLHHLSRKAQVGVLAHELSHVADFQTYHTLQFMSHAVQYTLDSKYGDGFEYQTDMRTILHGAGPELYAWSCEVRKGLDFGKLAKKYPIDTTRERYMKPTTILRIMEQNKR